MKLRIQTLIGSTVLSVLGATSVNAAPTINPDTGHYYEVVDSDGPITWDDAVEDVEGFDCLTPDGMADDRVNATTCTSSDAVLPHLATVTSSREDDFVDALRDDEVGDGMRGSAGAFPAQTWIGGEQDGGGAEPGGGWRWVNSEGDFPGVNGGTVYSNWAASEPNNAGGNEEHATLGRYGWDLGWNDELQTRTSIVGYIVEWDVPRPLEDCEGGDGCVTVEGQTLTYPEGSIPENTTLSFNSFEFLDPRVAAGTCGTAVLNVLGSTGIGPITTHPMKIPAYLCGSPKFLIVTVDTGNFFLGEGTVLVTHDTATVLPGNVYPDGSASLCEDPIIQDPFIDGDPQYQDGVVWQTTNPADMLEDELGGAAGFPGAAGEFTHDCGGSSRSRTKGGSDFGIGFHIDFGPLNTWAGNQAGNFNSFVALTRYKLTLLARSVEDANDDGAFKKNADYNKMRNMVANAITDLDLGEYADSLNLITNFLKFQGKAKYMNVPNENHDGEHLMRGGNIEFMLRVKIIPYASLLIP